MLWEDEVVLEDGTRIYVRVVQPSDRRCFEEGWQMLSADTRYFRFLGPRDSLSEEDFRYLTEFDGVDHYAVGAVTRDENGVEHPVAVARFVRLDDHPRCADFAITVVDPHQHRGVGTLMFEKLATAATKRGVYTFRADVLVENEGAKHLIRRVVPEARSLLVGNVLKFTVPISEDAADDDCGGGADPGDAG